MKRIFTLLAFVLVTTSIWAQAPQKMSYQAVIRNNSNVLVTSAAVGIKISVLQGTSTGTAVYVETHTTSTNANGLVSLQIGGGSIQSGTFAGINWANGPYFIKTETDPTGGTNYNISGTTELLSVPYALSAGQSSPAPGNAVGDMQYWNGTSWVLLPIGATGQVLKVNSNIPQWTTPAQGVLSTVTTDLVADVRMRKATITGTVTSDGGEFVITRGFCFGTTPTPTVTNGAVTTGNGLGTFSADITQLTASTTYYVRAFATTTAGTAYGATLSFTTPNGIALVTTVAATNIQACMATTGGIVTTDGGDDILGSGICYSTSPNPTIVDNPQYGGGDPYNFTLDIITSAPNAVYYFRAFAVNSLGAFYGSVLSFTTQNYTASVTTNAATQVKTCSATLSMAYTPIFPNAVDAYGICYSTSPLPTTNDTNLTIDATLTANISCLAANTTYYARAYISNCNGIKYGNQITFTTANVPIVVTTNAPTIIRACSIIFPVNTINVGDGSCGGDQNTQMVYSTSPNPTVNDNMAGYLSTEITMSNLSPNTLYYARGYTYKCDNTIIYGNQIQVTTLPKYTSLVTDPVTNITAGTATFNLSLIANGQNYIYYGFCYSTSPNPTIANQSIYYSGTNNSTNTSLPIQGLTAGTTYYVRAYGHGGLFDPYTNGCIGINYGNQVNFTTAAGPLVIGQNYEGGIIIKLNTPTSGIIAAATDQGTALWGCEGISITGTLATQGSGQANTNAILAGCTTAGTAAKICDSLILNGKSDWYLPSEQEMLLLGQLSYFADNNYQSNTINNSSYWSSTQTSATQARILNDTTIGNANKSDGAIRVRAVRSF